MKPPAHFTAPQSGERWMLRAAGAAPYLVALVALGTTLVIWRDEAGERQLQRQAVFRQEAADLAGQLQRELAEDEHVLLGAVGLFQARGTVTRSEWQRYVAALKMERLHPGIQGVGYSTWLPAQERDALMRAMRAEGITDFALRPEGERPVYVPVVLIEPLDARNRRALGFDTFSEPVRRAAMQRACDRGATSLSERVILVQETESQPQNGVLMFTPVFRPELPTGTVEERRAALKGFVYSPIRVGDFVRHTLGEAFKDIGFSISAGKTAEVLFQTEPVGAAKPNAAPTFQFQQAADCFGEPWNFAFWAGPDFATADESREDLWVLGGGLLITALLTALALALRSTRERALNLAKEMVGRLEVSEEKYRTLVERAPDIVYSRSKTLGFVFISSRVNEVLGFTAAELLANPRLWSDLVHPDDRNRIQAAMRGALAGLHFDLEYRLRSKSGSWRWLRDRSFSVKQTGSDTVVDGVISDITELKDAQLALQESERFARATIDALAPNICVLDERGVVLAVNRAWRQFAKASGDSSVRVYEGANYFEVCAAAPEQDCPGAAEFAVGLRAVLRGERESFAQEYACDTPTEHRWFVARVTRFAGPGPVRVVVAHEDLTERKRSEEAVRESEGALRAAQRVAHVGSWIWDIANDKLTWSDEMFRIFGIAPNEFSGNLAEVIARAIHPDDLERVSAANREILAARSPHPLEYRVVRPDGTVRVVHGEAGELVLDSAGQPQRLTGVAKDITDIRRAERALDEEANRRRILLEQLPEGMVLIDPETGRFVDFNPAAYRQLGYTAEEFARLSLYELDLDEGKAEARARIEQAQREGRVDFEMRLRSRSGEQRFVSVTAHTVDVGGQRVLQCVLHDTTEARRASNALREAHERLKRVGDNLPTGYVYQLTLAPDGQRRFTYISAGVMGVHGIPTQVALENPDALYQQVLPEDRPDLAERERRAKETLSRHSSDVRIRVATGQIKWIQQTSAPSRLPDGTIVWDGVVIDISERKEAEEKRLVRSKLESTGILAGGIAHDFNNLLASILLSLDVAQSRHSSPERLDECMRTIRQSTLAAGGLTKLLIAFARGGDPVRQWVSLAPLIRAAVGGTLSGSTTDATLAIAPDLWLTEVDDGQMGQVIRNLVLNAREAMTEGGLVAVRAENVVLPLPEGGPVLPAGEYVKVSVSDHGIGIAPDVLPRIFDPYFSTKTRSEQKGMGLGLTICHAIVQNHGGGMMVTSTLGKGSVFSIYLPASRGSVQTEPATTPRPRTGRLRGKILVMDDEPTMRRVVALAIEQLGCAVVTAENGAEAVQRFLEEKERGEPVDLAILDLMVRGGIGGVETLKSLRQLMPTIPAVVMSGYSDDETLPNYARFGFQDVLRKPFDVEKLAEVLASRLPRSADGDSA